MCRVPAYDICNLLAGIRKIIENGTPKLAPKAMPSNITGIHSKNLGPKSFLFPLQTREKDLIYNDL